MGVKNNPNDLVTAVLQLLRLRGYPCLRVNGGAMRIGARLVRFTDTPGVSDVLAILPPGGRWLAVECKTGRGKLTPDQEAFLAAVREAGGLALVVRAVDELEKLLKWEGY